MHRFCLTVTDLDAQTILCGMKCLHPKLFAPEIFSSSTFILRESDAELEDEVFPRRLIVFHCTGSEL